MMMNVIGAVPMVTMAQSAANWYQNRVLFSLLARRHAHSLGSHAFTLTLNQHSNNHFFAKRQLSYYRIWNRISF